MNDSAYRKLIFFLTLLPFLFAVYAVTRHAVDVLMWDEWIIWSKLLTLLENGELTIQHILAQQNEQRLAFAKVIGLIFLKPFHLSRMPDFYLNILMSGGIFIILAALYDRVRRSLNLTSGLWVFPVISLFVFSLQQWECFSVGINSALVFMNLTFVCGVFLLSSKHISLLRFFFAVVLGIACSFNFANALFYWPLLVFLIVFSDLPLQRKRLFVLIWLIIGSAVWYLYFIDYSKPPHHPSLLSALLNPLDLAGYFATLIGASFTYDRYVYWAAISIGFFGLGSALYLLRFLPGLLKEHHKIMLPWLLILLYALFTDGSIALSRSGFGFLQAMESRYVSYSIFFWIALLVFFLAARAVFTSDTGRQFFTFQLWFWRIGILLFFTSCILSLVLMQIREKKIIHGTNELYTLTNDKPLKRLFPDTEYLKAVLPMFFQARLTVFRVVKYLDDYSVTPAGERSAGSIDSIDIKQDAPAQQLGGILVKGHVDSFDDRPLTEYILIADVERILYISDVESDGTWEVFIPITAFVPGETRIQAFAVNEENTQLTPLTPATDMNIHIEPIELPEFTLHKYFHTQL